MHVIRNISAAYVPEFATVQWQDFQHLLTDGHHMVAVHAGCTKKDPIVVGKPAEFMLANIAEAFGLERHQICMVGDRLDTDILFGQDGGLSTMLVLSGVCNSQKLTCCTRFSSPILAGTLLLLY